MQALDADARYESSLLCPWPMPWWKPRPWPRPWSWPWAWLRPRTWPRPWTRSNRQRAIGNWQYYSNQTASKPSDEKIFKCIQLSTKEKSIGFQLSSQLMVRAPLPFFGNLLVHWLEMHLDRFGIVPGWVFAKHIVLSCM